MIEWVRAQPLPGLLPDRDAGRRRRGRLLSSAHGRDTAYVAVHQYRGMEWRPYFEAVEAIMDDYEGRPHWGKRHFQTAATLAPRYPAWAEFQAARDELDPGARLHQRVRRARPRPLIRDGPIERFVAS